MASRLQCGALSSAIKAITVTSHGRNDVSTKLERVDRTTTKCFEWNPPWVFTHKVPVTGKNPIFLHEEPLWWKHIINSNIDVMTWIIRFTMGHRRWVTAVTRLPRWRQWKIWLQVRPFLTMLQDMDGCDFWHANRYWIRLTSDTVMFVHYTSKWCNGALAFSGGRRVTWPKKAGDWGFGEGLLTPQR